MCDKIDQKIINEALAIFNDKSNTPSAIHIKVINSMVNDLINIIQITKQSESISKITPFKILYGDKSITRFESGEPSSLSTLLSSVVQGYFIDKTMINNIIENYDI